MVSITSKPSNTRTAVAVCTVRFSNPLMPRLIASNQIRKGDVLAVARIAGIMAAKRTAELLPLCHPVPLSHVEVEVDVYNYGDKRRWDGNMDRYQRDEDGRKSEITKGEIGNADVVYDRAINDGLHNGRYSLPSSNLNGMGCGTSNPVSSRYDCATDSSSSNNTGKNIDFASSSATHQEAGVEIKATVECVAQTGVEMEALCAANVAALTVYDMCKALDKQIVLGNCRVIEKRGGRSGDWKVEGGQLKGAGQKCEHKQQK